MHCPDPDSLGDDLKPVELRSSFDGCRYKNKTYNSGERFYDGCHQQCKCMGYGDMVCLSRCPPTTTPAPGQDCYTLTDVSDACCNVTVCDSPVLSLNVDKEDKESRILNRPWLSTTSVDGALPIPGTGFNGVKVGDFVNFFHGISGSLYVLNQSSLLVKDFQYDGAGPDAFFWAGTESDEPDENGMILPYPFEGRFYDYRDQTAPVLGNFRGNEGVIVLHLPLGTSTDKLKWLSVWCRAFTANFGEVLFKSPPESPEEGLCLYKGTVHRVK